MICGLIIAGGVHTAKTVARPAVTAGTVGMGNPAVSLAEDAVSGVTTIVAIVAPVLLMLLLLLAVWLFIRWYNKREARR
jgi:hypothetical protein